MGTVEAVLSIAASVIAIVTAIVSLKQSNETKKRLDNHINNTMNGAQITGSNINQQSGNNNSFNGTINK